MVPIGGWLKTTAKRWLIYVYNKVGPVAGWLTTTTKHWLIYVYNKMGPIAGWLTTTTKRWLIYVYNKMGPIAGWLKTTAKRWLIYVYNKMKPVAGWLKTKAKRLLIYVVGVTVIFFALFSAAFYIAKPYLDQFIAAQVSKRGIKAEQVFTSFPWYIHMNNVNMPASKGIQTKISKVVARPPLFILSGAATLYDVDIQRQDLHVAVPKLTMSGIWEGTKDPSVKSPILQMLYRINCSSIKAPTLQLSRKNSTGQNETTTIHGLKLLGYAHGALHFFGIDNLEAKLPLAAFASLPNNTMQLIVKSGAFSGYDADLAYAYESFTGHAQSTNQSRTIVGPIALNNASVDILDQKESIANITIGALKTTGLALTPPSDNIESLIKGILAAKKSNNNDEFQQQIKKFIWTMAQAITAADFSLHQASFRNEQLITSIESLAIKPQQWRQAIPEKLLIAIDDLRIDATKLGNVKSNFLRQIGYDVVKITSKIGLSYEPQTKTINANDLLFSVNAIASGGINAQVINVDDALFSGHKDAMLSAVQKMGLKAFHLRYSDYGFIKHTMDVLSREAEVSHDELKEFFETIMRESPALLISDPAEEKKLADTLVRFAKDPQTITLSAKALAPQGLMLADFNQAGERDLSYLLKKLQLDIQNHAN